eukprot:5180436-Lingulodinium_polyedra.AAC.1
MCGAGRVAGAMAAFVAFTGLLRISECLALAWHDVVFPAQHRGGNYVVLCLRRTKTQAANTAQ